MSILSRRLSWIVLLILEIEIPGCYAIGWICYIAFATLVTSFRASVRAEYDINGNPVEDFFACLLVYPSVAIQLETAPEKHGLSTLVPWDTPSREMNGAGANGHHAAGLVIENGNTAVERV